MKKIWISVCVLMLCLTLCACGESGAPVKNQEQEQQPQVIVTKPEIKEEKPVEEVKEEYPEIIVEDLFYQEGDYTDDVDNIYHYRFQLPEVTGVDTKYIEDINKEMSDIYESYIQTEIDSMNQKLSLVTLDVHYNLAFLDTDKGPIISILVCLNNDWGQSMFRCYNIDAYGEKAKIDDVLAAAGVSKETYLDEIRTTAEKIIGVPADATEEMRLMYQDILDKTLSEENINEETPVFLTAYGRLGAVTRIYSIAGADYYEHAMLLADVPFTEEEVTDIVSTYAMNMYGAVGIETIEFGEVNDNIMTVSVYENADDEEALADYTVHIDTAEIDSMYGDYRIPLFDIH